MASELVLLEQWRERLKRQSESGLTVEAFCPKGRRLDEHVLQVATTSAGDVPPADVDRRGRYGATYREKT